MTTETLQEVQLQKLPKWAQDRIRSLELTIKGLAADLTIYTETVVGKTNVTFNAHGRDRPLPEGSRIMFDLPDGHVSIDVHNDLLRVMGYGASIICQPQAGNHILIKPGSLER